MPNAYTISYTISDGRLLLKLSPAAEGGFVVTSPMEPELVTEAESVPEAFGDGASPWPDFTPPLGVR